MRSVVLVVWMIRLLLVVIKKINLVFIMSVSKLMRLGLWIVVLLCRVF